jgi:hypothetical protein
MLQVYNESVLVARLASETTYVVSVSPGKQVDLINTTEALPRLYVGHLGIQLQDKGNLFANGYMELENQELLVSEINYVCLRDNWAETRSNIRKAYTGWSPFEGDSNYSSLTFIEAVCKAETNKKVWWSEVVGLVMPRVS